MPAGIYYSLLVNQNIEAPSHLYFLSTLVYTFCAYLFLDSNFLTGKLFSGYKLLFALLILFSYTLVFGFPPELDPIQILPIGLLVLLYWPKNPLKNYIRPLRNIPLLKTSTVAFCFTFFTVIAVGESNIINISIRFLFYLALTLPFEVRDFKNDPEEMDSIVSFVGINNTFLLSLALIIICGFAPLVLGLNYAELQSLSLLIAGIPLFLVYKRPDIKLPYLFLDIILLIQPIVIYLGQNF
jgi:hypothetical protein